MRDAENKWTQAVRTLQRMQLGHVNETTWRAGAAIIGGVIVAGLLISIVGAGDAQPGCHPAGGSIYKAGRP